MRKHTNKQLVINFYKKVIGKQNLNYAKESVTEDYIQHNPQVRTGKAGLIEAIQFLKKISKSEKPSKPFMRIIADKEYVVVHLNIEFNGQKKTVLDLFRIESGLIAEHWDAIQERSEISLHRNSEIEGPILIEDEDATDQNKKIVKEFTSHVLMNGQLDTIKNYVASDLIQHHPKIKNGIQGLLTYYKKIQIEKTHRIIGQGNFVVTQSKGIKNDTDFVFYDIYRLSNGLICEHWSVSQEIPLVMAHDNGMI